MIHLNIWAKSIAITFSKDNYKMLINHTDMEDWEWSLLIMIIIKSFINIYFLHLFLFIFDHTTHCRIQSNALPISLQLTTIHPRLSRLRRTRDFPSDETAQLGAAAWLATGGWRAGARYRDSINTHAAHGGPSNYCTGTTQWDGDTDNTHKPVRISLLNNRTYTPHP